MKGQLVLVAFPAASDRATLQKLSSLAEAHPSVRVLALLEPGTCTPEQAAGMAREWRWLLIDRDDISSRQRLGLAAGEVALFDRCGRLSRSLPLSASEELKQAMRAALHHASCGWCQYGAVEGAQASGNSDAGEPRGDKKLNAFFQQAIATRAPQERSHPNRHQQQQQQHQQQQHHNTQSHQMRPQQQLQHSHHHQQHRHRQQQHHQQQLQPTAYDLQLQQYHQQQLQLQRQQQAQPTHRSQQPGRSSPQGTVAAPPATSPASPADDYGDYEEAMGSIQVPVSQHTQAAINQPQRAHKDLFAPQQSQQVQQQQPERQSRFPGRRRGGEHSTTSSTTTESSKKQGDGGIPFEDYTDYEDYGAMKTFGNEEEATEAPARSYQSRARSVDQQQLDQGDEQQDEDEMPCKAITDDICYHQKKSGRKLSKCCKKGIYIADFCLPGKCSNTTVQACCLQKYLQAKFQCCEKEEMEGTSATDAFSRCCHAHFVHEDDCCPSSAASEYWASVHDICLPNVHANLTSIKMEIRMSEGVRVIDLSASDKWEHECRYGARRAQYVYVPPAPSTSP